MNQKVSRNKTISYFIIAFAVLIFAAIWPTGLIRHSITAKSDEVIARESDPISVEYNLTQMFDGIGGILQSVDLYVCNDMADQTISFRLYDQEHKQIYEQFYNVPYDFVAPGFIHIPIRYELIDKSEYSFIVEGLTQDLYLAYEDRLTTTSPVNYYMAYGGAEVPEYDVIVRYNVDVRFSAGVTVCVALLLIAVSLLAFFGLRRLEDKEVELGKLIRFVANPILAVCTLGIIYITLVKRLFGPDTKNNAFIALGFILLLGVIAYIINFSSISIDIKKIKEIDIMKVLQIVAIATVIWYCYEYMNGLYEIFHSYSICKLLIAFSFVLIFTFDKKELFNIYNAVWLIAGPVAGYLFAKPHFGENETGELYRLYGWLIAAGGFVVINVIYTLVRLAMKKVKAAKVNIWFAIPFAVFAIGISILSNTRYWVWILVGVCTLLMFRLVFWENRGEFSANICAGIILNFYMMVWFSINHRPYYYYQFYRYYMGYHTVTVTAYYLTLIICAALVALFCRMNKTEDIRKCIPQLFTLGMAGSFLVLTMSRTGFLSTGAVAVLFIISVAFIGKNKNRLAIIGRNFAVIAIAVIYMFPVTYGLVDVCPRIANDPVTFEYEYREFTFEKGMPYSNPYYMTIEQFCREFGRKVFGIDPDKVKASIDGKDIISIINEVDPFVDKIYAAESDGSINDTGLLMSQDSFDEVDVTDMSNGRFDIFKSYIKVWNLWGHDEMGAELPDGEIAVHAHNTFLQVIHDHGLVFGIYFVIFMLSVFIMGVKRAIAYKDGYEMLMPVLMVGFCVASLVEWIFHLCNPFGLALFMSMMPLIISEKGLKNE